MFTKKIIETDLEIKHIFIEYHRNYRKNEIKLLRNHISKSKSPGLSPGRSRPSLQGHFFEALHVDGHCVGGHRLPSWAPNK